MLRFASMLPEHGWEVTVLAPRDTPHEEDPNLVVPEEHVIVESDLRVERQMILAGQQAAQCIRSSTPHVYPLNARALAEGTPIGLSHLEVRRWL